ncbi:MAG: MerR family transcriptional regulator [Muribaculaceae bacterium]|nr:MerR family transcriptional regulator [Muribaculaceae bacterium]
MIKNAEQQLDKRFYRIGDVAQILQIPASTLRFWEKEFTIIKPHRNAKNIRFYTPKDIETIRMIYYLVKEKGLKLDAAQEQIRRNKDGVSRRFEVVEKLRAVKDELKQLERALTAISPNVKAE